MSLVDVPVIRSQADDARDPNDPNCSAFDALDADYDPFSDPHHQARYDARFDGYDASGFPIEPRPSAISREQHYEYSDFRIADDEGIWSNSSSENSDRDNDAEAGPSSGSGEPSSSTLGKRRRAGGRVRKGCTLRPATWSPRPPSPDYVKFEALIEPQPKQEPFPGFPSLLPTPNAGPDSPLYHVAGAHPRTIVPRSDASVSATRARGGPQPPAGTANPSERGPSTLYTTGGSIAAPHGAPQSASGDVTSQGGVLIAHNNNHFPRANVYPPVPPPTAVPRRKSRIPRRIANPFIEVYTPSAPPPRAGPPLPSLAPPPPPPPPPLPGAPQMVHLPADMDVIARMYGLGVDQCTVVKLEVTVSCMCPPLDLEGSKPRHVGDPAEQREGRGDAKGKMQELPKMLQGRGAFEEYVGENVAGPSREGSAASKRDPQSGSMVNGAVDDMVVSDILTEDGLYTFAEDKPLADGQDVSASRARDRAEALQERQFLAHDGEPSQLHNGERHTISSDKQAKHGGNRHPVASEDSRLASASRNGLLSTSQNGNHGVVPASAQGPSLSSSHYDHVDPRDTVAGGSWMEPSANGNMDISPPPSPIIRSGAMPVEDGPYRPASMLRPPPSPSRVPPVRLPDDAMLVASAHTRPPPSPGPSLSMPRPTVPITALTDSRPAILPPTSSTPQPSASTSTPHLSAHTPTDHTATPAHPQPPPSPLPPSMESMMGRFTSVSRTKRGRKRKAVTPLVPPEMYGLDGNSQGAPMSAKDGSSGEFNAQTHGQNGHQPHGPNAPKHTAESSVRERAESQALSAASQQNGRNPIDAKGQKEGHDPIPSQEQQRIAQSQGEVGEGGEKREQSEGKDWTREESQSREGASMPPPSTQKLKRKLCGFKSSASAEPQSARPDPNFDPAAAELFDHVQLHAWACIDMHCPWRGCDYHFRGKSNGFSNLRKHLLTHWKTRSSTVCPLCLEGITVNGPMSLTRHYASGWCNALQEIALARNLPLPARAGDFSQDVVISAPVVR